MTILFEATIVGIYKRWGKATRYDLEFISKDDTTYKFGSFERYMFDPIDHRLDLGSKVKVAGTIVKSNTRTYAVRFLNNHSTLIAKEDIPTRIKDGDEVLVKCEVVGIETVKFKYDTHYDRLGIWIRLPGSDMDLYLGKWDEEPKEYIKLRFAVDHIDSDGDVHIKAEGPSYNISTCIKKKYLNMVEVCG